MADGPEGDLYTRWFFSADLGKPEAGRLGRCFVPSPPAIFENARYETPSDVAAHMYS